MNIENQDLKGIREQLPHGAIAEIAKNAGVLAPTVSRALNGDTRSPKLPEIITAIAEYLNEYKAKERKAKQALNNALKPETSEQLSNRLNVQSEKFGECINPLL